MITLNSLSKIYRTTRLRRYIGECESDGRTWRISKYNGTFRMRKIHPAEHNGIA